MLAVRLPEPEIRPFLNGKLSIAAVNSPNLCVVSGTHEAVEELEKQFTFEGRSLPKRFALRMRSIRR